MNRRLGTRRGRAPFVAAAACAVLVLSACSGDTDPDSAGDDKPDEVGECQAAEPEGSFEFSDARGKEIELDTVPTTVVAQNSVAASLWDAGYQVDGIFGELGDDPASVYQRGSVDLSKVTTIGSTWGEFDIDEYAQMTPDLLLDFVFDGALWYVPSKQEKKIEKRAPILGVNGQPDTVDEAIEMFVDLAGRLGADTTCNEALADAKDDYDEALGEVVEEAKGLKVLIASGTETTLYVVNPVTLPETKTLTEAGIEVMGADPADPLVFKEYSWEEAGQFADADVILIDGRNSEAVLAKMGTIDTWANLPAVKAGQVGTWYAGAPYSYAAYADILDELADVLENAEPLG
ncbi:ABC transporter substrate-binding protein [Nocardioides alcanivorans]|uniref:ABC transporter substrate-binding protein n=1 Tax=Nocardioides alcanivorans TaxID=2897352 RepID=UPI001F3024CF|nr:ABC transporter substrate-binding protein [Nocardioides alcanivorans]